MGVRLAVVAAALSAGLALAGAADGMAARASGSIPQHGVFVVGKTLAGVGLGMTPAQVKAHWGSYYHVCPPSAYCTAKEPVWLFEYSQGEPLGVGVRFLNGRTVAVFTLGAVGVNSLSAGGGGGWKTAEGLHITDPISELYTLYPKATIQTQCILYNAISMRQGGVTSSFYTASGTIYGFALTAPGQPVCV